MYHMYDGKRQEVELKCDNSVVDSIIDRFGEDIPITPIDDSSFQIKTSIAVNHVFYSWFFGFGGKVSITSPATVREKYLEMVLAAEESTKL